MTAYRPDFTSKKRKRRSGKANRTKMDKDIDRLQKILGPTLMEELALMMIPALKQKIGSLETYLHQEEEKHLEKNGKAIEYHKDQIASLEADIKEIRKHSAAERTYCAMLISGKEKVDDKAA